MTEHRFNDAGVCEICSCSKGFVEKNRIVCEAPKPFMTEIRPDLAYGEIAIVVGIIQSSGMEYDLEGMISAVKRVKDFNSSPAETNWVLMEFIANRKKWREIATKVEEHPTDEDYESTIWKPKTVLQVEVDRMANTYRIKAIKG